MNTKKAYFAAGCFWGVEYYFAKLTGVVGTTVGYMGGTIENPRYEEVKTGTTGHLEVIEVEYNTGQIGYEALVKYFFEIHNFEQIDGQGPDIGTQYVSAIFVETREEHNTAIKVFSTLTEMGYKVATQIRQKMTFYKAEDYHQDYYEHKGEVPYCHAYHKIFK